MEDDYKVLKRDKRFNIETFNKILEKNRHVTKLAIAEYRFLLLFDRNKNEFSYICDKENLENLFLEEFSDKEYKKILDRLKKNNWSIEQAYEKARKTGRTLEYISRIRNV